LIFEASEILISENFWSFWFIENHGFWRLCWISSGNRNYAKFSLPII